MIRRILLFLAVAGCHSVTIRVDRGSSAAIERDDKFIPLADAGGRFISEPPTGLIDCPDLLVSDNGLAGPVGIKPCADSQGMRHVYQLLRHGTGDGAALRRWQALGHAPMTVRIAACET